MNTVVHFVDVEYIEELQEFFIDWDVEYMPQNQMKNFAFVPVDMFWFFSLVAERKNT